MGQKIHGKNLTQKFCNHDYRDHRANLLFEQKKSLLPRISNILSVEHELESLREEEQRIAKEYRKKMREIRKKENKIIQLKEAFFRNRNELELTGEESSERSGMNRPCITESCLGFLDGKGFCPICKKITCLTCNIQKVENEVHECKDSDKAMWIEIRNTTKPCPSCRVRIFKISGCDQCGAFIATRGFPGAVELLRKVQFIIHIILTGYLRVEHNVKQTAKLIIVMIGNYHQNRTYPLQCLMNSVMSIGQHILK